MDHDQRFKEVLREFVWELAALFLPWLASRLTGEIEWQSQEVFTNPPLGLVRRVDLLAQVKERLEKKTEDRLLHVEVESAGSLGEVRKKLGYYYPALRTKHNQPVTTLAVYLKVGLQGEGWDEYAEQEGTGEGAEAVYRVRWRYAGLPALPAERYLASSNWLGVALAALMRIEAERKPWLRAEILRRLALECKENDYRKLLLVDCVEAYLPMQGEQEQEFQRLLGQDPRYQEATKMFMTLREELTAKARREELCDGIVALASPQCGAPDAEARAKLAQLEDLARLRVLLHCSELSQLGRTSRRTLRRNSRHVSSGHRFDARHKS